MSITEAELVELIKRRVSPPPLDIGIADQVVMDCIDFAKRWYVTNAGTRAIIQMESIQSIVEYQLPPHVVDVTAVRFTAHQLPAVAWDWEFIGITGVPVNHNFMWAGSTEYSSLVQMLQHLEEGKRIVGAEPDWRYRQQDRILELYPASNRPGHVFIEVISSQVVLEDMPYDEQWLLMRWAIADTKEVLGRQRSKHSGIPGPGGDQQLDGERLLEEAKEEKDRLQEEMRNRRVPIGFITG